MQAMPGQGQGEMCSASGSLSPPPHPCPPPLTPTPLAPNPLLPPQLPPTLLSPQLLFDIHLRVPFNRKCLFKRVIEYGSFKQAQESYTLFVQQVGVGGEGGREGERVQQVGVEGTTTTTLHRASSSVTWLHRATTLSHGTGPPPLVMCTHGATTLSHVYSWGHTGLRMPCYCPCYCQVRTCLAERETSNAATTPRHLADQGQGQGGGPGLVPGLLGTGSGAVEFGSRNSHRWGVEVGSGRGGWGRGGRCGALMGSGGRGGAGRVGQGRGVQGTDGERW